MLGFLEQILHGVLDLPYLLVGLLVTAVNGWILALAAILTAILAILPGFPSISTLPTEVLAGVAWFLPVTPMIAVFATFVTAFIIWLGAQVALRWVKAL
jgi:hypothetical protein